MKEKILEQISDNLKSLEDLDYCQNLLEKRISKIDDEITLLINSSCKSNEITKAYEEIDKLKYKVRELKYQRTYLIKINEILLREYKK